MISNEENGHILLAVNEAAKYLNIDVKILKFHIEEGKIPLYKGMITKNLCDEIMTQKSSYVGIRNFLMKHDNERFESRYAKNRNKYIEFLEVNSYFGIKIIEPEEILFELPHREDFYITKEDAQFLEFESDQFFLEFGLSDAEKIEMIYKNTRGHELSKKYIKKFIQEYEENEITPSTVVFVKTVLDIPDLHQITYDEITSVIEEHDVVRVKALLRDYYNYVRIYENVKYVKIEIKKEKKIEVPAYSYEEYVQLAKLLFNEEYAREHNLWNKVFEKSENVERWMYLACHYICGWRSADICDQWIYPNIKDNENPFKIDIYNLKDDILNERISNNVYSNITLYCIRRIEMAALLPSKTGLGKLRSEITPELRVFFGKLILIAEYFHFSFGKGYMNKNKTMQYKNWVECKEFFGEEMYLLTGKTNLMSRRLNKSYLQGIEKNAIENGETTLVAHIVASYARSHSNINSTLAYLHDHGLTGESADVVLYMMMQRGVFGVVLYNMLLAAYPDSFMKLSIKEQTAIMQKIPLSAYDIEAVGTSFVASEAIIDSFEGGYTDEPIDILRAMLNIGQGIGRGKDQGVFCKKRALGFCCEKPTYNSCIANLCPYHIFTDDGIPALIEVIKYYRKMELETGNKKYSVVLNTKIKPAFKEIINSILKEMNEEESKGLQVIIREMLNEQSSSYNRIR